MKNDARIKLDTLLPLDSDVLKEARLPSCVRCGKCNTRCSVYLERKDETYSPRGKIAQLTSNIYKASIIKSCNECINATVAMVEARGFDLGSYKVGKEAYPAKVDLICVAGKVVESKMDSTAGVGKSIERRMDSIKGVEGKADLICVAGKDIESKTHSTMKSVRSKVDSTKPTIALPTPCYRACPLGIDLASIIIRLQRR